MFKSGFRFFCVCINQSESLFRALPDVPAVYVNIFVTKGKYVQHLFLLLTCIYLCAWADFLSTTRCIWVQFNAICYIDK